MEATSLSFELERLLVREFLDEWRNVNRSYFKGALTAPVLSLAEHRSHLGRWTSATRTLELSRPLVLERPWGVVVEVLKHEMAHQYVHEVLGRTDETAHGPAFREVCARLGIDAAAAGMPDAPAPVEDRIAPRIARLLALAESPNVHEAEAAMAAAQRLMLKYNLEARSAGTRGAYGFRHLGPPSGRVGEPDRLLAMILAKHFFVEVIWVPVYRPREGKRGSVLEVCGTPENLALAEHVHSFLRHTAERLWVEHKRAGGLRGNRDRRVFLAGVMAGFAEKLAWQAKSNRSRGLVWVKDGDLEQFYRRRHPHIRNVRYGGQRRSDAFAHGKEAGKRIVIHRPVKAAGGYHGRLLGPSRS